VLGVFGLSIRTVERDLDDEFSRFGRVEKVTIVYDQRVSAFSILVALEYRLSTNSLTVHVDSVSSKCQLWTRLRVAFKNSMA
jgi:hypothetical protein